MNSDEGGKRKELGLLLLTDDREELRRGGGVALASIRKEEEADGKVVLRNSIGEGV
jgi:hypothetical protein